MSDMPEMSSQRPYLLRAMHEWISDNGMTPYLLVNANFKGVHVPPHTVRDGQVVLNIAERAVHMLSLGNEYITFNARFGGVSHEVFVPVAAVLAIYARETGQGMGLPQELDPGEQSEATGQPSGEAIQVSGEVVKRPVLAPVASGSDDDEPSPDGGAGSSPKRGHLRVVK